ncbi:MAG: SMP-30/gluconolactonase/LRE family protein [Betaproteobacteria bacterium]|nr:SMP-30/gluconolactonase/LRE family protein [Betaproteobacteria bacterium]
MTWKFEKVAGPYQGPNSGLAWDGSGMLFSLVEEGRILRFDPKSKKTGEFRKYTNRITGIGFGPKGELYGCQEGGRRVIEFMPDGSARPLGTRIDGRIHNFPNDLTVDSKGRIWFADPHSTIYAFGPQIFPQLEHASVLRLERDERRAWTIKRITFDTVAPRAIALSADEQTLYVAEGDAKSAKRELRAYPVKADGTVGPFTVLHVFGADHRGLHRGIEGLCLDRDGNIVACAGAKSAGPGPMVYVISPSGAVLESHALPGDLPVKCAFGDSDLSSLYVTTGEGMLYRAKGTGRRGMKR